MYGSNRCAEPRTTIAHAHELQQRMAKPLLLSESGMFKHRAIHCKLLTGSRMSPVHCHSSLREEQPFGQPLVAKRMLVTIGAHSFTCPRRSFLVEGPVHLPVPIPPVGAVDLGAQADWHPCAWCITSIWQHLQSHTIALIEV